MLERLLFGIAFITALIAAMWIPMKHAFSHAAAPIVDSPMTSQSGAGSKE